MKKYIYNKKNGLWYELQDNYYLPCLKLAEKEGIMEAIKVENQMLWVQMMNNIRNTAMEIVSSDFICAQQAIGKAAVKRQRLFLFG